MGQCWPDHHTPSQPTKTHSEARPALTVARDLEISPSPSQSHKEKTVAQRGYSQTWVPGRAEVRPQASALLPPRVKVENVSPASITHRCVFIPRAQAAGCPVG